MKRWGELTWNDFLGIPKPFSAWGAVISSNIYLEYDSVRKFYSAFAAQNNQQSWVIRKLRNDDYSLNHEQYHFNISEIHARILDQRLDSSEGGDASALLASQRMRLKYMQNQYDDKTRHGLRVDMQRRLEYKIDSMLQHYSKNPSYVVENYSGAKSYFPCPPEYVEMIMNNDVIKFYHLDKYDMQLSTLIALYPNWPDVDLRQITESDFLKDLTILQAFEKSESKFGQLVKAVTLDTLRNVKQLKWYFKKDPYVYQIYGSYPLESKDTVGYELIANSFFNAFRIENTDDYFLSKVHGQYQINTSSLKPNAKIEIVAGDECMTYLTSKPYGFFRGPIYNEEGNMLFAYDAIQHEDSLLLRNIIVLDNKLFSSNPSYGDQILFVPRHQIPEDPYWASFGYFLKEDTSEVCFKYYNQMIFIDPSPSEVISAGLN
jgi:hypothetical protein